MSRGGVPVPPEKPVAQPHQVKKQRQGAWAVRTAPCAAIAFTAVLFFLQTRRSAHHTAPALWRLCLLLLAKSSVAAAVARDAPIQPTPGVTNVVFTLVRGNEDADAFAERSKCLQRTLANGPAFDQIIFHEGDLPSTTARQMQAHAPNTRFFDAHNFGGFAVPEHVTAPVDNAINDRGPLGYRQMVRIHYSTCMFYSHTIICAFRTRPMPVSLHVNDMVRSTRPI
eukprot:1021606-Prymnesium_polylepis.1